MGQGKHREFEYEICVVTLSLRLALQIEGDFSGMHTEEISTRFTYKWEQVSSALLEHLKPAVKEPSAQLLMEQLLTKDLSTGIER